MTSLRRIHRHLSVEELEPRIAPGVISLSGIGTRTALLGPDADGDMVFVSLGGSRLSAVNITTTGLGADGDITRVEFTQANRNTSLTFSFAPGGRVAGTIPLGDVSAAGLTLGTFISMGLTSVTSFTADEVRLVRLGSDGVIDGPVTLSRFTPGERIEAGNITARGILTVDDWSGGTVMLSGNMAGIINGLRSIPGRISIGGNLTGVIAADGLISNILIGGDVAPGARLESFTGFGNIVVNGGGGFQGILSAMPASRGIASLNINAGPFGGQIFSNGPLRSLFVSGDIQETAGINVTGTMNSLRVGGSVLAVGLQSAQINVLNGNIGSIDILGPQGLQGSITATGVVGPINISGGGIGLNPLALPNLQSGGGFTGGIWVNGNVDGVVSATNGPISGLTMSGSLTASARVSAFGSGISNNLGLSQRPAMAMMGGNPIVAWQDNTSGDDEIYVLRFDGTTWVEMGINSARGGGISNNTGASVNPAIAVSATGTPYLAWQDNSTGNYEIYVLQWNGLAWVPVGATINVSNTATASSNPSIMVDGTNNPIVAWSEFDGADTEIYVRRWDGANWVEMGVGSASGQGISNNLGNSQNPVLLRNALGDPIIAWSDNSSGDFEIYVRQWNPLTLSWDEMGLNSATGGGISDNEGDSVTPVMALGVDGTPVIAWADLTAGNWEIYLRRWNGTAWTEYPGSTSATAGGISNTPLGDSLAPSLAIDTANRPIVVWSDNNMGNAEIFARRWSGTSWIEIGTFSATYWGISNDSGDSLTPVVGINGSGVPIVAWTDNTPGNFEIFVRRFDGASWLDVGTGSASGGSIGTMVVGGPFFAGVVEATQSINSITQSTGNFDATIISYLGSIQRLDVRAGNVTAVAQIQAGTSFGTLNVPAGNFDGMLLAGTGGITGGVIIGNTATLVGDMTGRIISQGPITKDMIIGRDLSGVLSAGSAGTSIIAPLTVGRDLTGVLEVAGGAASGRITIGRDVTATAQIKSTGSFGRNLQVGGLFTNVPEQTAAHSTIATAQDLTGVRFPVAITPARISTATQSDFYRFRADFNQTLWFNVDSLVSGGTMGTQVRLYDSVGNLLYDCDPVTSDPEFSYTFPATDDYYVEVRSHLGRTTGNYKLTIQQPSVFAGLLNAENDTTNAIPLNEGAAHNTRNTAQPLSLIPFGTIQDTAQRVTEYTGVFNDTIASAQALPSVPASVQGTLSPAGDVDVYRFNIVVGSAGPLPQPEVYRFSVSGNIVDGLGNPVGARLILRDGFGAILRSVDANVVGVDPVFEFVFPVGTSGTFYAEVRSSTAGVGTGAYKLDIQKVYLPYFVGSSAFSTAGPGLAPYVTSYNDDIMVVCGSIDEITEEDWYSFWVESPTQLALDLDAAHIGSPLRAQIELYDSRGNLLAFSNDGAQANPLERDPDPILTLSGANANPAMNLTTPGMYYVRVISDPGEPSTGPYRLYLSTGNAFGYKTSEYGINDTLATANFPGGFYMASSTSASQVLNVSGVIRVTSTTRDVDLYAVNFYIPPSGQNVTYLIDVDTYPYGAESGSPFRFPNGNLRLRLLTTAGAVVTDINNITMDNNSEEIGRNDPMLQWTPSTASPSGVYYVEVSTDPYPGNAAEIIPSNIHYDLRVGRVYFGGPRTVAGMLGENTGVNKYMGVAQDLNCGTMASFVIRDSGGTTDFPLGGLVLEGLLDVYPGSAQADPWVYPVGDIDYYRFNAIAGQELSFNLSPRLGGPGPMTGGDPLGLVNAVMKLYDASGNLIAQNDNATVSELSTVLTTGGISGARDIWPYFTVVIPQTGTYYLEISGAHPVPTGTQFAPATGNYSLTILKRGFHVMEATPVVDSQPSPPGGWSAGAVNLTRPVPQILSGTISTPNEQDKYTIVGTGGNSICLQLLNVTGSLLQGRLQLWDMGGKTLLESIPIGPDELPTITAQFPRTGYYQIVVSSEPTAPPLSRTGDYQLLITPNIAHITGNINISGNLDGAAGGGIISAPGSLIGNLTIGTPFSALGDVRGGAQIEFGLDMWGDITIGNLGEPFGGGSASVFVGGHMRPNAQLYITGDLRDTASVFTRFADGSPGPSASSLRVDGKISSWSELTVAPPGGLTGWGYVYLDDPVADGGVVVRRKLYNLDDSGTLTGFYAEVSRAWGALPDYGNKKAYAPNRDFAAAGYMPNTGPGTPGVQVQMYYEMDRYHSYMSLLGYASALNRVVYAEECDTLLTAPPYPTLLGDIDYNHSMWLMRIPNTNGQSLASMGDLILHAYNRAVNQGLVYLHGNLGGNVSGTAPAAQFYPSATLESPAIDSGLADYRAASFTGNPWIGEARTDAATQTLIDQGYLRIAENFYRWDVTQYSPWGISGTRLGGRVLTGILWELRNVLGQYVTDTLSMAALEAADKASTQGAGTLLTANIGRVSAAPGNVTMLDALIAASGRLFDSVTHARNVEKIRQAFAAHGVDTDGTYGAAAGRLYNWDSTTLGVPVGIGPIEAVLSAPSETITPGTPVIKTYPATPASTPKNWVVRFDDILTKLEYGERIEVWDMTAGGVLVDSYTPPVPFVPTNLPGFDRGRGWQNYEVSVPNATQIQIRLYPDADSEVSLGFRAFIIDPEGSGSGGSVVSAKAIGPPPLSVKTLAPTTASFGAPSSLSGPLLDSLFGLVTTSEKITEFAATSEESQGSLTVNDIARESDPIKLPPPAPSGVFSLQVYKTLSEVGESGDASTTSQEVNEFTTLEGFL